MKSGPWTTTRCLVLALFVGPGSVVSLAPPVGADQPFVYDTWQRGEGLPQDSVTALFQDRHSYLWIGTQEGLARFDSHEFAVFDRSQTSELASNWIYDLAGDAQGSLWIATRRGLTRFHRGEFQLYTSSDGLPHRSVRALHLDRAQRLWIGTDGGLALLDERREAFETVLGGKGLPAGTVLALCEDLAGTLWVGTESGLGRVGREGGRWIAEEFGPAGDSVFALQEDRAGVLWVGTASGLRRRVEGKVEDVPYPELAGQAIRALHEDVDGILWIGTGDGIFRLRGKTLVRDEQWPHADVRTFLEDHEGGLWVGLWTGGLTRATRSGFSHFSEDEGLPGDVTWTVYQDRAGVVWVGTNGGLTRIAGGEVRTFPVAGVEAGVRMDVTTLLEDRQGTLWAGTWERGLARLHDGRLELDVAGPSLLRITCLLEDRSGMLWIGTDGRGLHRRAADGSTRAYTVSDGLPSNVVHDVYEDTAGTLWIATDGGMTRWVDGRLEPLAASGAPHGTVVTAIYGERGAQGETLWLGTLGEGLLRLRDGTFVRVDRSDALPDDKIHEILEDDLGQLWISSPQRLLRIDKQELNAYVDKRRADFKVDAFDRSSGLWSDDFSVGNQPAGVKTADGRLWLSTVQGVVVIDPANVRGPLPAPPVHIFKVSVDGQPLPTLHGQPVVPAGAKKFEFFYKVLDYSKTRDVRTRHMLVGTDEDWVVGDGSGVFQYTNLEPGRHVFKVETAAGEGGWQGPGHALTFTLRPTFRQTWYFYLACVLGAVLLGGVAHRLLVRRLVSYNEDLRRMKRELEQRNSELARFIYTLSHDIKNPLLTIRTFVGVVEKEASQAGSPRMRADLHRIHDAAETLQEILDELLEVSRIGRVVNPPTELLLAELLEEVLGHFVDTFREERIEVVVKGEFPVVLGDRRRLFEIFQNLVENAVKFLGDEEAPRIEIGTRDVGSEIVFYVRDNGIGVDPRYHEQIFNLFHQLDPAAEGIGAGLASVRHIVELHGGRIWVESEGKGRGATFAFTLPGLGR